MPLAIAIIGLCLVISAARGTHRALGSQFAEDVGGQNGFIWWVVSLCVLGVIGAWGPARTFSRAMMGLALLAFILSNRGVFAQGLAVLSGPRPVVNSEPLPTTANAPAASTPGGTVAGSTSGSEASSTQSQSRIGSTIGSVAGGIIGGVVGGPVGAMAGSALGGMAGGAIEKAAA